MGDASELPVTGNVPTALSVSPDSGEHWTEPGAWPAAPGVHRIPLPLPMDGLRAVNVYAIETPDGLTLIDGGWAIEVSRTLLEASLASVGFGLRDVREFLVTHVHRDHYTQAVAIRSEYGAKVSLGLPERSTLDLIRDRDSRHEDPHLWLLRAAGAGHIAEAWADFTHKHTPDLSIWAYPDTWLEDDLTIAVGERRVDAVATPGHTKGHYVFADRAAEILFAGDHVLPTITPSIGFEPVPASLPLRDFLGSLTKVRAMPDALLLPAHGPVAPSVHARVDELLEHHDHRLRLCLDAVRGGDSLAIEVARELPWTRHERRLDDMDVFNSALAVLETRAHLELLVAQGRLTSRPGEGETVVYGLPAAD